MRHNCKEVQAQRYESGFPLFSILITVFNREMFLARCLASVSNQRFSNYEVVLIDDGSTDRSLRILEEYAKHDLRVRLFSQKNQGSGPAFKAALSKARGRYIVCLDSDDWLSIDALERLASFVHVGWPDIVQFEFALDKKNGFYQPQCHIGNSFIVTNKRDIRLRKMQHHLLSTWRSKAIKTDVIKGLTVYGTGRGGDNIFIAQAIHLSNRIGYLNGCIYYCDVSDDSDSRKAVPNGFFAYCLQRWLKVLPWFVADKPPRAFMFELGNVMGLFTATCVEAKKQNGNWRFIKEARSLLLKHSIYIIDKSNESWLKAMLWLLFPRAMAVLHGTLNKK